jgi:hypothetical protein
MKNRSGKSADFVMPIRVDVAISNFSRPSGAWIVIGPLVTSTPFCVRLMPIARVNLPGPLAKPLRPVTGSSARMSTHEHASGDAFRFADDVQAIVHAVDEVHVCMAGRAEDDLRSGRDASGRMRRPVVFAQVCFRLDAAVRAPPAPQASGKTPLRAADPLYRSSLPLKTISFSLNLVFTICWPSLVENSTSLSSISMATVFGNRNIAEVPLD